MSVNVSVITRVALRVRTRACSSSMVSFACLAVRRRTVVSRREELRAFGRVGAGDGQRSFVSFTHSFRATRFPRQKRDSYVRPPRSARVVVRRREWEKEEKPKAKSGASFVDFQGALGMSRRLVVSFTRALFSAQQAPASPKRLSSPRAFLLSTNEKPKDARERPRASARRRNSPKRTVVTSRYLTSRRRGPDRASRITRVSRPRVSSPSCAPR